MSLTTQFAHGASGGIALQGFAQTDSFPTTLVVLKIKKWDSTLTQKNEDTSNTSVPSATVSQAGKQTLKITVDADLELNTGATGYATATYPLLTSGLKLQGGYCLYNLAGGTTTAASAYSSTAASGGTTSVYSGAAVIDSIKITNDSGTIVSVALELTSTGVITIGQGS